MEFLKVRLTFIEEVLGTSPNNPEIHDDFIASKAPDAKSRKEEIEAIGVGNVIEKSMTVFPRDENHNPFIYDYQIKGFFKDTCGMMRKEPGSLSSKIKAYKKLIDGLIFVVERQIPFRNFNHIGECQRPLRAQTLQGERISLAHSETIPAGSFIEFTIKDRTGEYIPLIKEWLDYGSDRGIGQWRNSGKGRFIWEEIQ